MKKVYQINENCPSLGWVGAFVLSSEEKEWGIQGFVHVVESREANSQAWIRLPWDQVDLVGQTNFHPEETPNDKEPVREHAECKTCLCAYRAESSNRDTQ